MQNPLECALTVAAETAEKRNRLDSTYVCELKAAEPVAMGSGHNVPMCPWRQPLHTCEVSKHTCNEQYLGSVGSIHKFSHVAHA